MKIPGMWRLKKLKKRIQGLVTPGTLILMYHRVAEIGSDPWGLCVSPQHFAEHLQVLQKLGCVVSLRQLQQMLENGKHPSRSVVVTFDDGYADNLYNAKPLLEKYNIPATVFFTTGYMNLKQELWWDELDRLLLQPGTLPEILQLKINGEDFSWSLGNAATYTQAEYQQYRNLLVWQENLPSVRHRLYYSLYKLLYPLPTNQRQEIIDKILTWGSLKAEVRETHRFLTLEEMDKFQPSELIEIGGHSVNHPFLSTISYASQEEEIKQNKAHLEDIFSSPVVSFAYPHGDFNPDTVQILRQLKFSCACTTNIGRVARECSPFELPRVQVENWDGNQFEKHLSIWFRE